MIRRAFCKHVFRSNYGQAGTLSIDLDKVKSQWAFFTIWEDHTEVAIEPQWKSHFHFWEEDKLTFFQPHLDLPAHLEKPLAIKA